MITETKIKHWVGGSSNIAILNISFKLVIFMQFLLYKYSLQKFVLYK